MWISVLVWLSSAILPFSIFYIVGFGLLAKRPGFDDFLAGAAKGMKTTAEIFPTLAALLISVRILRVSGFLDFLLPVISRTCVRISATGAEEQAAGELKEQKERLASSCSELSDEITGQLYAFDQMRSLYEK